MRDFVIEVKEREAGGPCFLLVAPHTNIALGPNQHIVIDMPEGSDITAAQNLARTINNSARSIGVKTF